MTDETVDIAALAREVLEYCANRGNPAHYDAERIVATECLRLIKENKRLRHVLQEGVDIEDDPGYGREWRLLLNAWLKNARAILSNTGG